VIDAANIDWKGFTEEFYRKHCSADMQSVLDATVEMYRKGVHIEITFLIIPQTNDSPDETRKMAKYLLDNLGPDVPLHLSQFHPDYKFSHLPPTPVETLLRSRDIAKAEGLHYVYVGNVHEKGLEDTICPRCGTKVIERIGFNVTGWRLSDQMNCMKCGLSIPIIGQKEHHVDF
jgi:pyruvate formate lyase activating enzyme